MREETRYNHFNSYSFRLAAKDLLYAPSHRQDSTYHGICHTNCGALTRTRDSSVGPPGGIDPTTYCTMSGRSTTELHGDPAIRTGHVSRDMFAVIRYSFSPICKALVGAVVALLLFPVQVCCLFVFEAFLFTFCWFWRFLSTFKLTFSGISFTVSF